MLEFRVLGALEVWRGKDRVALGGPKQRAVLAQLLVEADRVVSADRLVDQLWAGSPPVQSVATVQVYLSNLRRALEPERVVRGGSVIVRETRGYVLRPGDKLDSRVAQRLISSARAALRSGDTETALTGFDDALAHWRGRSFADFADEPWARAEATRLDELRLAAVEDRVDAVLALGRHAELVGELERLVAEYPLRERMWGQLMLALYRSGRQVDALGACATVRRTLADELGLDLAPRLRELEQQILAHDPAIELRAKVVAAPVSGEPLTGRETELAVLERSLAAVAGGHGRVMIVEAAAGDGKTRLGEELAVRAARRGFLAIWARAFSGAGAPAYWPWTQLIRTVIERRPSVVKTLGAAAAVLRPLVPELAPEWSAPPVMEPAEASFRLWDAVAELLRRLAGVEPLLLLFDDLQWSDAASMRMLRFVVSRISDVRVLMMAAHRTPVGHEATALTTVLPELLRERAVERMQLRPFRTGEIAELLTSVCGRPVPEEVARVVAARSGGNAFIVTELARLLARESTLDLDRAQRVVPINATSVLAGMLDRLDKARRATVDAAAVLGRDVDAGVLAETLDRPGTQVRETLESLVPLGILAESKDGVRYCFVHDLIRETAYHALRQADRAELHGRIADALTSSLAHDPDRIFDVAAHTMDAVSAGRAADAVGAALQAATRATELLGYDMAEELLDRAAELVELLPPSAERTQVELAVHLRRGELLLRTRGYASPRAGAAWRRAYQLSRLLPDRPERLPAMFGMWAYDHVSGRFDDCRAHGEAILAGATGPLADLCVAYGHLALGITALHQARYADAADHLTRGPQLCDEMADPRLLDLVSGMHAKVLFGIFAGVLAAIEGHTDRAVELAEEAIALAERRDDPFTLVFTLTVDHWRAMVLDDPASALRRSTRGLAIARKHGLRYYANIHAVVHGWAVARLGDPSTGEAELRGALTAHRESDARMLLHWFHGQHAEVLLLGGRPGEALDAVAAGLSVSAVTGERFYVPDLYRISAMARQASGDHAGARAAVSEAAAIAGRQGATATHRRVEQLAARLAKSS